MAITYKDSGVDVSEGDRLVDWLVQSPHGKQHHQKSIVSGIGGFASLFRADFSKYKKPLIVTCTDGVGTKVKLASHFQSFESVGQDLVAMCVNDLICCGGDPLLFLDYYATGKLVASEAQQFLLGVQKACDESLCALVGGETAEMPGVYKVGDFDCAGFAVGVVDEEKMLGAHRVYEGDVIVGISSNGFHSNGYSLIRKVFEDQLDQWKEELLKPTHLYVKLVAELKTQLSIHALAHITGGGIDNIPRVLPENLAAELSPWTLSAPFEFVKNKTGLSLGELYRTLNCGVGLAVILPDASAREVVSIAKRHGFNAFPIGRVIKRPTEHQEIVGL